jgi:hypothetical protein
MSATLAQYLFTDKYLVNRRRPGRSSRPPQEKRQRGHHQEEYPHRPEHPDLAPKGGLLLGHALDGGERLAPGGHRVDARLEEVLLQLRQGLLRVRIQPRHSVRGAGR